MHNCMLSYHLMSITRIAIYIIYILFCMKDTSVALDALSRYAAKVKSKSASVNVEITADGDIYAVQVQSTDKLSNKELNFDGGVPKNVKVSVKGKGCILAQVLSTFHLEHLMNSEAFKLGVDVNPVSTIDKCSIAILSPCISYSGSDLHSNMAVLEVTMPSGYEADSETLHKLVEESHTSKLLLSVRVKSAPKSLQN